MQMKRKGIEAIENYYEEVCQDEKSSSKEESPPNEHNDSREMFDPKLFVDNLKSPT